MNGRLLLIGLLVVASAGCNKSGDNMDMGNADQDMRTGKAPDMTVKPTGCAGDGVKAVGESCTNATKCDCSGPKPSCITDLPNGLNLPDGYCTNKGCDTKDSSNTCGDKGICLGIDQADPTNTLCFQSCKKKAACGRPDYACEFQGSGGICLPKTDTVDCDPTADPATQCKMTDDKVVNGNPNAPCFRGGYDDVGNCMNGQNGNNYFPPCNIGPSNCPTGKNCIYIDTSTLFGQPSLMDKFKGGVCLDLPAAGMVKKQGESCLSGTVLQLYACDNNLACNPQTGAMRGTCQQSCYNGMQPVLPGAKFKNDATACPMGTKCTNVYNVTGANWPGICLP